MAFVIGIKKGREKAIFTMRPGTSTVKLGAKIYQCYITKVTNHMHQLLVKELIVNNNVGSASGDIGSRDKNLNKMKNKLNTQIRAR